MIEHPPELRSDVPGPRSRELAARQSAVESPVFEARRRSREKESGGEQAPIVYDIGEGINVTDVDGNRFVDLTAGFGALVLGHSPKHVIDDVQATERALLLALGDVYPSRIKVEAMEAIAALHPEPGARVMLGMSGADAVTTALKSALLHTKKPGVIAFVGSYHGLSHGPLAACGLSPRFREPFREHLSTHVTFAPYPGAHAASLDESLSATRKMLEASPVGAILVEPILGRGGCVVPPDGFLRELGALAKSAGALLIVDEIWTGMGRSGAFVASASEVVADLICFGKGLGAGFPISACVGRAEVMSSWGEHGGSAIHTATHFGSPGACQAALTTLQSLRRDSLPDKARDTGEWFRQELRTTLSPEIHVDGRGLMIGIRLASAAGALRVSRELLRCGYIVLTGGTQGDTLTLTPPLGISRQTLQLFSTQLHAILSLSS